MQETLQQREAAMRAVLHKIQNKIDFNTFTFEEMRIAKECQDAAFFEGIVLVEMISGHIVAEYRHEPRLTHKGIQFLDSTPQPEVAKVEISLSDAEHKLQAEKDSNKRTEKETERKKDRKFQILTALLSGLVGSLLTLFVEHFQEIVHVLLLFFNQNS